MQSKAIESLLKQVKARYATQQDLPPTLIDEPVTTLYKSFDDNNIEVPQIDFSQLLQQPAAPMMGDNAEANIQAFAPFGD